MFKDSACKEILARNFQISFQPNGEPVPDDHLYQYVLELDDATKVMVDPSGRPLNFSELSENQFLESRNYIDSGQTEKILDMK
jgi:hypothetical protein